VGDDDLPFMRSRIILSSLAFELLSKTAVWKIGLSTGSATELIADPAKFGVVTGLTLVQLWLIKRRSQLAVLLTH
jgi:hypothetical protein